MSSKNIILLALVTSSIVLSLLADLNQFVEFFSNVSLPTVIISTVLALTVATTLPSLLRNKWPRGEEPLGMPLMVPSIVLAIVIFGVGVGPFINKVWDARQDKSQGMDSVDLHRYGPARIYLARAARRFDELGVGFGKSVVASQLGLIQAYAGLGDRMRAEELIDDVIRSGPLDAHLQGKLDTIRGNIAYQRGEFEQAERFYQVAHQTIEPRSRSHAALLQNQASLWLGRGAPYRSRVIDNYEEAKAIYQQLDDRIGLAHMFINEGTLIPS